MVNTIPRPMLHKVMERAADNLIPFQATLEVTHRCNLACKHCYLDTPPSQELSLAEIKSVLDQLAKAGTMYLLLTGGECLARPDFFDIAFYARERGFMVMLLTNGTLISPEIARKLKELNPIFIGMSLHGATPGTHDAVTGRRGSLTAMLRSIKLLKSLGLTVSLQTLVMESNIHEVKAIKILVERLGVYHQFAHEFVPGRSGSSSPFQYEASLNQLCSFLEVDSGVVKYEDSCRREVCKAGHGICSISATGDVFPCLLMPMKIGNLRQATFQEIWKTDPSPELTRLRSITWDDFSACKECKLVAYCRKCMGVAFTETGELTKPAPSACRNAALKSEFLKRKGVIP